MPPADSAGRCRVFVVSGRVQGVFFRASTATEARRLGLTGHAINRPNGTVEVLACGGEQALTDLAAWLEEGPPLADVHRVVSRHTAGEPPSDFVTR